MEKKLALEPGCVSPADVKSGETEGRAEYVTSGGELRLSNPGQLALLKGMEERGVPLRTTVRGFSMHPFIRDLDVLTIAPLNNRPPRTGEVVAFSFPETGRMAIHRITRTTASGWLLKGDNCREADGLVTIDRIIGRVTKVERGGKEVRFGLGVGKGAIAVLNRGSGLFYLKMLFNLPRRAAGFALRRLQGLSLYRRLARCFMPPCIISEADEEARVAVQHYFNPSAPSAPQKPNPNVTDYVATAGSRIVGFAQLVYHPEKNHPWTGYWLFSLHVWGFYRGSGIGEKLGRQCIEAAKSKGASELLLLVYEDNKRAIALDRKLGFAPVTHPALEPLLEAEKAKTGRRRIVMRRDLE